jgi:NitT/TauT family transport system substrate-binding protein
MKVGYVALALLLCGCGAKSVNIPVRMANVGPGIQTPWMPLALANTLGYYKDEGLEATLEGFSSNAKTLQALVGGSVDVAGSSYSQIIQIAAEGQPVKSFFIMSKRDSMVLIVAPNANKKIRRIEDLKGSVIGVPAPGSPVHQRVNHYLAAHGILETEVSAVGIGVGASAVAAVESGRIDAAGLSGGDHFYLLQRHPDLRILIDASTAEGMRETYGADVNANAALSAKQDWLARNPEAARRLARALRRTLEWIAANSPEEIRARLPASSRSQDAAVDIEIIRWSLPSFTADGAMPKNAPETVKRFLGATMETVRDSKIDLAATWTNEFLPEGK